MIRSAARVGDAAIVIATEAHLQALAGHFLREDGGDNPGPKHTYFAIDANEMLSQCKIGDTVNLQRLKDLVKSLLSEIAGPHGESQRRLFVYGEMVGLLCSEGKFETALGLEQMWNDIGRMWMMSLLCGYPIGSFDQSGLEKFFIRVCAMHATVSPPDSYPSIACERRIAHAAAHSSWLVDDSQLPPS